LEAGLRLLLELPASSAFGHLTANRIATAAGRTTGAFFHQWATLDAYLNDFVAYVLRPEMSVTLLETVDTLTTGLGNGATFAEALVEAGRDVPERTARDPQTVVELLMWNRALHDEEFRAHSAQKYRALDAGAAPVFENLMTLLGREPRPPFTAETIGAVCIAVAEGLALRASLNPGFYPNRTFGWIILALIPLLTRVPGDEDDAAGWANNLGLEAKDA
jgi:AcrR family transcriptional regulator